MAKIISVLIFSLAVLISESLGQDCTCGIKQNGNKIVGGVNSDKNEYPWRCSMKQKYGGGFCGCSVISEEFILTAAHCLTKCFKLPFIGEWCPPQEYEINIGDHNINENNEVANEKQTVKVANVMVHPQWDAATFENDVAVIKLNTPLSFKDNIQPICLPFGQYFEKEDFVGEKVEASGWGRMEENGPTPDILQKVNLTIITNERCNELYDGKIKDGMMCALDDQKDTCQGDSGGSIDWIHTDSESEQLYYAVGIVSWGEGCAREDKPGVYARVTKYLGWIDKITNGTLCKV